MQRALILFLSVISWSCASESHPDTSHIRIHHESQRTGICALHHVPLVTIRAYQYDFAFGAAIDWDVAGMTASTKYPNVLSADQSRVRTREYHIPTKVRICPICQRKFDDYLRSHSGMH